MERAPAPDRPLTDTPLSLPPLIAGRYSVTRELGRGGMATVYLARDERHDREVALKVFRPDDGADGGSARFLNEIQLAARLAHPNILPLHDSGQGDGFLYYVMPFVPGENLRERLEREGALPVADALAIAAQVVSALAYAHSHGVIHRDIKPENILFLAGQAVVADFGIARAISAGGWSRRQLKGEPSGTPAYMSPEQASGASRVDGRSDLYSLGCVLYEMLTGEPPFRGTTPEEVVVAHLESEPEPVQARRATLSADLQAVVGRALAKHPADRYATAQHFGEAIARAQSGQGVPAAAAATPPAPRPAAAHWKWLLPAAAIAAVVYAAFASAGTARGIGAGVTDPGHIVVAPLVHQEGGTPALLTGEQCSRLLRNSLARWNDVSLVDSRWFDDRLARLDGPASLDDLLRLAREARAGRLVSGEVWSFRDSLRIRGVLYDTGRRGRILRERVVTIAPALDDLEARFQELADSLLLPHPQTAAAAGGALGTRSLTAWRAYDSAHAALARWELPEAAAGFTRALERDPGYALAHLWLAQARSWMGEEAGAWRDHALAGLGGQPPLASRDREWALALAALADSRFPEACQRYEAMIARDSLDFRGWYGRAECRARDRLVVKDPGSPSGWAFRSSYHAAIADYHTALTLVPSAHVAFRGAALTRLSELYYAEPNTFRRGILDDPAAADFAGFPALDGDTLALVPWPLSQVQLGVVAGMADPEAIRHNRRRLMDLTREWARAFPRSPVALEADAIALELAGEFSGTGGEADTALRQVQRARGLSGDAPDRVRLASVELRLLLKLQRFQAAAALADSVVAANPAPSAATAPYLAAAAALVGRAGLAARFSRLSAPRQEVWTLEGALLQVPLPLRETALALEAFAAIGAPTDSLAGLYQQAQRQLASFVSRDRRAAADAALFDRTRVLLFPHAFAVPGPREKIPLGTHLRLQQAARTQRRVDADSIFGRLNRLRAGLRVGAQAVEGALAEAQVELAIGDTAAAVRRLDGFLEGLSLAPLDISERTVAAGSLVRIMALRARVAGASGESAVARRWAGEVVTLWRNADSGLRPVLEEMRALAARPS